MAAQPDLISFNISNIQRANGPLSCDEATTMASDMSRKRRLSDGEGAPLPRIPPSGSDQDQYRWPRALGSGGDARQYQNIINTGSSRSQFGDTHHHNVTNNYHSAVGTDSQTEDDKRWATFKNALAFDRMDFRRATIDPAHNETCRWVLDTDEYRRWRDKAFREEHHGFLWIKGKPGVGKSTIMKFLLEHMKHEMPEYTVISFFFNARGTALETSAEGLYRSLLLQLLNRFHILRDSIEIPYGIKEGQEWAVETVQDLFREALYNLRQERLILIIDALDEGDHQQVRKMVEFLASLARTTHGDTPYWGTCFASRHFPNISTRHREELIVETQTDHMSDIEIYIHENLAAGSRVLASEIVTKSQAVFMWVVLVVRSLNEKSDQGANVDQLMGILKAIPSDMDDLLSSIIREGTADKYFVPTLQWILAGTSDLEIEGLYFGIRMAVGELTNPVWECDQVDFPTMERFVIHSSKGLVEWSFNGENFGPRCEIRFIHEPVRQHLLDGRSRSIDQRLGGNIMANSHAMLATWCQDYLRLDLVQRLGALMNEAGEMVDANLNKFEDDETRLKAYDMFPLLQYTLLSTFRHVTAAHEAGVYALEALLQFPLQEWINVHNLTETEGDFLLPSTAILHLLLLDQCYTLAQKVLLRYYSLLNRHRTGASEFSLTGDSCADALVGSSLYAVCGGSCGTPLTKVAYDRDTELVQLLLACGADVNLADDKSSPLGIAAGQGNLDIARLFLEAGANINYQGGSHGSPLGQAAWHGQVDCMRYLIEQGANVDQRSENGRNIALEQSIIGNEPHEKMIALLLSDHRARFEARDLHYGLMLAAERCLSTSISTLISFGADSNGRDEYDLTALHVAAGSTPPYHPYLSGHKHLDMLRLSVQTLLEHGADVNAIGGEHGTALIAASAKGYFDTVRLLLNHQADVSHQSEKHGTALEAARAGGHNDVLKLLLAAGSQDGTNAIQGASRSYLKIRDLISE